MLKWCLFALTLAGIAFASLWAMRPTSTPFTPTTVERFERHFVTPDDLSAAERLARQPAEPIATTAHDGTSFRWPDAANSRPLALVFVKAGCPCSEEFEPHFRRLHTAYGDVVTFAAVVDGDVPAAREFVDRVRLPYPALADPAGDLGRRFHARNGGYLALLTATGTVDSLWPGCSTDLFADLGRHLAASAGVAERPLDLTGLPGAAVTGCPLPKTRTSDTRRGTRHE